MLVGYPNKKERAREPSHRPFSMLGASMKMNSKLGWLASQFKINIQALSNECVNMTKPNLSRFLVSQYL